ncbi:MAG: coenzyme F420-0:L-glutamate ligase/coenzyme F420-1:gamma-L-glutamate ligase [Nitriliruptoraceae bacterium]|jgi:coenzyme F420-0:L-glutamate ligase/coenzyme F420-1:gamma-L-glutamate ligase
MTRLEVIALPTTTEVRHGTDLCALLLTAAAAAGVTLRDGDVVAIVSKVVAKSEGNVVTLPPAPDHHAARRLLARAQARRVVAETASVLIVETHHGFVCANAGIDTSNLPDGDEVALLLPDAPDRSAAELRAALAARVGVDVGVVVTDTFGRPWRLGLTDVALGAAGVEVLRDDRGSSDREGRTLDVTITATADQLAAAADLVRTKSSGTPFVLLRGLHVAGPGFNGHRACDLIRPSEQDAFRTGGPTAGLELLQRSTSSDEPPASLLLDDALLHTLAQEGRRASPGATFSLRHGTQAAIEIAASEWEAGRAATAVCVAAAAFGWSAQVTRTDHGATVRVGATPTKT